MTVNWSVIPYSSYNAASLLYILYIVMASDLKPLSVINMLFKFADDTTFLVPENTDNRT